MQLRLSGFLGVVSTRLGLSEDVLMVVSTLSDEMAFSVLRDRYHLPEDVLFDAAREVLFDRIVDSFPIFPDQGLIASFGFERCIAQRFFPLYKTEERLCIAVDNPFCSIRHDLEKETSLPVFMLLLPATKLNHFLTSPSSLTSKNITILDEVLEAAIHKNASDIHIFKRENDVQILFRLHGELHVFRRLSGGDESRFLSLIKFHSQLDVSITTQPQDGRLSFMRDGHAYDIRVASLPTVYGEDFVLRIFNKSSTYFSLDNLGIRPDSQDELRSLLGLRNGLILVTGPTGSGKTTTLYAALSHLLMGGNRMIVTLEDPVERVLPGIRQSQINSKIGYDFVKALRATLRQDPDIIMIGEIRDKETAQIALEAAYTGHLVLSTLHTGDCESTLMRLSTFDLDPFLISHALKGIISQRLAKHVCLSCHQRGCELCHYSGFSGRVLLTEMMNCSLNPPSREAAMDPRLLLRETRYSSFEEDIAFKIHAGLLSKHDI